jgi:hypothetical protein
MGMSPPATIFLGPDAILAKNRLSLMKIFVAGGVPKEFFLGDQSRPQEIIMG